MSIFNHPLKAGTLVFEDRGNPYETREIYLERGPEILVKSYICEHGPDGGSSWRIISIKPEDVRELEEIAHQDLAAILTVFFRENAAWGLIALTEFLTENEIPFESRYCF